MLGRVLAPELNANDAVLIPYYEPQNFNNRGRTMTDTKKKTVKKKMKTPPRLPIKSVQHDLFCNVLANDPEEVSNTIDLWERIPKFILSPKEQTSLRTEKGHADPYKFDYSLKVRQNEAGAYEYVAYTVEIQPALIEQPNGSYKAYFPSTAEEIIEEVLKKIFTRQGLGVHDAKKGESWVKFSLSMINIELRKHGASRTIAQIKHSLEIMSKCVLTVFENEKKVYAGGIFENYLSVDRKSYLDDSKALHGVKLSSLVSHSINTLQYRQFNLPRMLACKSQLARFLLRRLINRFIQASLLTDFDFLFSRIKGESGLLRKKIEGDNRKKVIAAFDELKKTGAIYRYEVTEKREGNKIIDVAYKVFASQEFSTEQKAANARANMIEGKAGNCDLQIVDKSKPR